MSVSAHFRTEGAVRQGTKQGTCTGFEIEMHIHSNENHEQILNLISLAHMMCYAEDALLNEVGLGVSTFVNGEPV